MNDNILDLIRNQQMNAPPVAPAPPVADERAQIVVAFKTCPAIIFRFKRVSLAEATYAKLVKAWINCPGEYREVKSDKFDGTVALDEISNIAFVDWDKYDKFISR